MAEPIGDPIGASARWRRMARPSLTSISHLLAVCLALSIGDARAEDRAVEIHDQIGLASTAERRVALTLDACSGAFDEGLIDSVVRSRISATVFATKRWLDRKSRGVVIMKNHLDLFDVEGHGENHIPAVIGASRRVCGIPGEPDVLHLRREVLNGAQAIENMTGVAPHWYRGATAEYDQPAADESRRVGFKIAGFTVNADADADAGAGATLLRAEVEERLRHLHAGDVIIAHMKNKPSADAGEGLRPGLIALLRRGLGFVRLDQMDLESVP